MGGVGKALLVKDGPNFYAVGNKCTHYGAPLEKGMSVLLLNIPFISYCHIMTSTSKALLVKDGSNFYASMGNVMGYLLKSLLLKKIIEKRI